MRVMLLTPDAPAPRHVNGGTTRQYKIFSRLLELGHEVTIVGVFAAREDPFIEELREHGFNVVPYERPTSRLRETLSAIVRRPSLLLTPFKLTSKEIISAIFWVNLEKRARDELENGSHDVLVVSFEWAAWWLGKLNPSIPAVIEIHELESPQHEANAERGSGVSAWLRRLTAGRSRRSERRWIPQYDGVVMMSEDESAALAALVDQPLPPTFSIGNGANIGQLSTIGPDPGDGIVIFTGTMRFPPNANGALWLANEVWPRVLAKAPDARLQIVGSLPPHKVLELGERESIEVIADVPDMAPYFAAADVCLLPMHEGGGTRLKLADAMAAGRAIVSTNNGAAGVKVTPGKELLIADDAEGFADAIVELLGDRAQRARLGAAGRETAIREYDWKRLGDSYADALESVVAGGESRLVVSK